MHLPDGKAVRRQFAALAERYLVAIYKYDEKKDRNYQTATGFMININGIPFLLTAAHSIYGASFKENSHKKNIFLVDSPILFNEISNPRFIFDKELDIAILTCDEFLDRESISIEEIAHKNTPKILTVAGYLARDFKKDGEILRPSPRTYSGKFATKESYIALHYQRGKVKEEGSDQIIRGPILRGLSGGPIINTELLCQNTLSLCGIFIERDENSDLLLGRSLESITKFFTDNWEDAYTSVPDMLPRS